MPTMIMLFYCYNIVIKELNTNKTFIKMFKLEFKCFKNMFMFCYIYRINAKFCFIQRVYSVLVNMCYFLENRSTIYWTS